MQGSSPCSTSIAKMSTMRQHCEHALLAPRPFWPWEYRFGLKTTSGTHDAVCSRTLRPVAPAPVARGRPTEEQVAVYVVAQYSHHGRKGVGIVIVDTHDNTRHITGGTIPTYLLSWLDSFATNSRRRSRAFFPGTVPGPRLASVERLHGSPQGVYRRIQQRPRDGGFGVRPTRQ